MLKKLNRNSLIVVVAFVTILFDQVTKVIARQTLNPFQEFSYLANTIVIQLTENTGAFLSMGAQLPEGVRFMIFSVAVALGLGYVTYSLFKEKDMASQETFAWAMIIGGGIGNLIDRVFRGSVTDFLNMGIGNLRTGIFNIADVAVTAGAIILLLITIKNKLQKKESA